MYRFDADICENKDIKGFDDRGLGIFGGIARKSSVVIVLALGTIYIYAIS